MRVHDEQGRFVRQTVEERFWQWVNRGGDDDCWLWTGDRSSGGYGRITDFWKKRLAHRVSYEIHVGPIPPGKQVCHRCDVPLCVNPRHLWVGSAKDNSQDAVAKGRHVTQRPVDRRVLRGEENVRSVLTDDDVRAIRLAYRPSPPGRPKAGADLSGSLASLASQYGVSKSLVHNIVTRKAWAHVD